MAVYKAEVKIRLKKGVADPEGQNTMKALAMLGFKGISAVSSIKTFQITLTAKNPAAAKASVDEMCTRLLANPVIHTYTIQIQKA